MNTSYRCSCGLTNSLLNSHCADRKCKIPNPTILSKLERFELIHIDYYMSYEERRKLKPMSDKDKSKAERHSEFFADEKSLIKDMSIEECMIQLAKFEDIILEARARASANDDEIRQKRARLSKDERDKLISNPDYTGSDALATVNVRKERMTKADKMLEGFVGMGLDEATIKKLMENIKSSVDKPIVNKDTMIEASNKDNNRKVKLNLNESKAKIEDSIPLEEPFNPDKLFG